MSGTVVSCAILTLSLETVPDTFFHLWLFADEPQREAMAAKYRQGGFGYGEVKKALADLAVDYYAAARERRRELEIEGRLNHSCEGEADRLIGAVRVTWRGTLGE